MNISLIGMMGCGKTTIGKLLAEKLNLKFIDTDEEIIKMTNTSINKIFEIHGEETFRELESKVLNKTLTRDNQVISTGGGIVKSENNINELNVKSVTFYLKAESNELLNRLKNDNTRPLLNTKDVQFTIEKLLSERETKYKKAKFTINTTQKTPDKIVQEIIGLIK